MGNYLLNVYIDDEFAFYLGHYGDRPDVGEAFPDYPTRIQGVFDGIQLQSLKSGEHKIRVGHSTTIEL